MKKFLFKNDIGSVLLVLVITIFSVLLSTTLSLIVFGLGVIGLDTTFDFGVPSKVYDTSVTVWTLIMIVGYILSTVYIWVELLIAVDAKYNTDNDEK